MLKNQARFKPDALATAFDNTNYSRWMIAPSRTVAGTQRREERALRHRDGRAGRFRRLPRRVVPRARLPARPPQLPEVPAGHLLGRRGPSLRQGLAARRRRSLSQARQGQQQGLLPGDPARRHGGAPGAGAAWPRIDQPRLAEIERRIRLRATYVVPRLIASKNRHKLLNLAADKAWSWYGKGKLLKVVHRAIESDLIRRDQLELGRSRTASKRAKCWLS